MRFVGSLDYVVNCLSCTLLHSETVMFTTVALTSGVPWLCVLRLQFDLSAAGTQLAAQLSTKSTPAGQSQRSQSSCSSCRCRCHSCMINTQQTVSLYLKHCHHCQGCRMWESTVAFIPASWSHSSIFFTTSMPLVTEPNTTCCRQKAEAMISDIRGQMTGIWKLATDLDCG